MTELIPKKVKKYNKLKWVGIIAGIVFGIFFTIFAISTIVLAVVYSDRVAPGLHIGKENVGGFTKEELKTFLQNKNDQLASTGVSISFATESGTEEKIIYPVVVSDGNSYELIYTDIQSEVERIIRFGKRGGFMLKGLSNIISSLGKPSISLAFAEVNEERLEEELRGVLKDYEHNPVSSKVVVKNIDPLEFEFTTSSAGVLFDYKQVVSNIVNEWNKLNVPEISIKKQEIKPDFTETDLIQAETYLKNIFATGSLFLAYDFSGSSNFIYRGNKKWEITQNNIAAWISPQRVGDRIVFGLDKEKVIEHLEEQIAKDVNVEAQDARFKIGENGKVEEFAGSQVGYDVDMDKNYELLNQAVIDRGMGIADVDNTFELVIKETDPVVKTGEINELGIKEVLGVGTSNFSGSPRNRIKNIQNAVNKLNGLLIKPGEEFAAIKYLQPFTEAGGYLPELVIKGDEIKPEIGGGLCQIGTTLFRMAMNSGMEITERRNHSLVVSYYNDPVNHLPGTDATIYDPSPDFKFRNDTQNYILIEAVIDWNKMELIFTIWGTTDGRTASYTHPVVSRWIPHGPTKFIETTKLAPGVKQCQHAYTGADAYFTYTRQLPGQDEKKIVFESHYRPLPEICLVGVGGTTTPIDTEPTSEETAIE